ncbi:MAG: glucose sorbosone dehydrogenase [Rhodothermales bacterium]|nr:glucose sorbosone dehydrogenase [Rhodothermales bacterium]
MTKLSLLIFSLVVTASVAQESTVHLNPAFPQLAFQDPVALTHAGDGSGMLFVVEQGGTIRSFVNSEQAADADLFLDIRDRVVSGGERGLLGLAFHPQYPSNGRFFVYYTANTTDGMITRLSRFERDGDAGNPADPQSETVFFEVSQTASNHNGGDLAFGLDGTLYVSIGDGGGVPGDAQNRTNLLGTIARIDVDEDAGQPPYGIPDDNPFVGNEVGIREEIFAYGLRNPWRFSIDAETGMIWAGDVGQNDWEEVDIIRNGGNYGWPIREGYECYQAFTCSMAFDAPVFVYENGVDGRSVTGGYVYRGALAPDFAGAYVFGDFISGRMWRLDGESPEFIPTELETNATPLISAFGEDEDQELYVLDYGSGTIFRFESAIADSNEPPADADRSIRFRLAGPNPFVARTSLAVDVPRPTTVRVDVYDMLGRRMGPPMYREAGAGLSTNIVVDADEAGMTPGVYVARLTTEWGARSLLMTRVR